MLLSRSSLETKGAFVAIWKKLLSRQKMRKQQLSIGSVYRLEYGGGQGRQWGGTGGGPGLPQHQRFP